MHVAEAEEKAHVSDASDGEVSQQLNRPVGQSDGKREPSPWHGHAVLWRLSDMLGLYMAPAARPQALGSAHLRAGASLCSLCLLSRQAVDDSQVQDCAAWSLKLWNTPRKP